MTDTRALVEYLKQQRLLGGDSVILTENQGAGSTEQAAGSVPVAPAPGVSAPSSVLPAPGLSFDPPSADLFATDPIQRAASLEDVALLIAACRACKLCEGRRNTVPGEGPANARLVVIGEGPGRTEDETGRPFVGRAGELLTKILEAMENRLPQYDEIAACLPFLYRQIDLVKPKAILAMGGTAAQSLLNTKQSLGSLRNQIHRFRGIPVVVTYHPAALLRNPHWKRPTWDDVRIAARLLDN